jgi:ribosome-binding factor A
MHDPRIKDVTVTRAEVSADLQHAKVYVSIMGTEKEQQLVMHGLQHAKGYLQRKIGDRLQVRFTPAVQFVLDKGVKNSIEISRLINEAKAQAAPPADRPPADGPADEDMLGAQHASPQEGDDTHE